MMNRLMTDKSFQSSGKTSGHAERLGSDSSQLHSMATRWQHPPSKALTQEHPKLLRDQRDISYTVMLFIACQRVLTNANDRICHSHPIQCSARHPYQRVPPSQGGAVQAGCPITPNIVIYEPHPPDQPISTEGYRCADFGEGQRHSFVYPGGGLSDIIGSRIKVDAPTPPSAVDSHHAGTRCL